METREGKNPRKAAGNAGFHAAVSYVRLRNKEAAGEIDRHMADYKLLRNLVGVFLLDLLWSLFDKHPARAMWDAGLMVLSFIGFVRLYYWTRLFAFQYEDLLPATEKPTAAQK